MVTPRYFADETLASSVSYIIQLFNTLFLAYYVSPTKGDGAAYCFPRAAVCPSVTKSCLLLILKPFKIFSRNLA